ncbi:MAG: hypothetical protein COY80_03515 [Candidatus Pacebacteria bacterium CG_4_10_14_0_8_um_filter_42_14]|nr:MAG: hypothetical protein COY80_03515 [Candidatus Pacebacteria bacterium CG_4_10_14_0_8_um_filter_42_14]
MTIDSFLIQLCEHCGMASDAITAEVTDTEDGKKIQLTVPEEDSGLFIGFHGETLESLQRIIRLIFQETPEERLLVNVNNYREQRQEKLEDLVKEAAERVASSGNPHTFQSYLPAYERYIVHASLAELPDADKLESTSDGMGRDRRLTIKLKTA